MIKNMLFLVRRVTEDNNATVYCGKNELKALKVWQCWVSSKRDIRRPSLYKINDESKSFVAKLWDIFPLDRPDHPIYIEFSGEVKVLTGEIEAIFP